MAERKGGKFSGIGGAGRKVFDSKARGVEGEIKEWGVISIGGDGGVTEEEG